MSFEAVLWATSDAPISDVNEFAVLVMLAEKADSDGCNTFPSRATIAARTKIDPRTILRCLQRLEERRLIGRGDQRAAEYIRADRRPTVYDLLIPYTWFPNIERTNKERQERGRAPLTAKSRPDIAPAPMKRKRSDAGKKRKPRGDLQSPRTKSAAPTHGVTTSPERGDYKSGTGCLEDTRTSPLNQPLTLSRVPSVTPGTSAPVEDVTEERETSRTGSNDTAQVPEQRVHEQELAVVSFVAALPGRLGSKSVQQLAPTVAAALAAGWTETTLRAELSRRVVVDRIQHAAAIPSLYQRALEDLPAPPAPTSAAASLRCVTHPGRAAEYGDLCVECHSDTQAAGPRMSADELAVGAAFRQQLRNRSRVTA